MKPIDHNKMITAAARAILRPIGCIQKGRSRTWLDDRGWWVGVIEFQPSGWSRGSYLNVGASWLWYEKDLSFDDGHRAGQFIEVESEDQFAADIERLVIHAKAQVQQLRARHASVSSTAQYLHEKQDPGLWGEYHAAIACGLVGRAQESRTHFRAVASYVPDVLYIEELQRKCRVLEEAVADRDAFRGMIEGIIAETRKRLRLPAVDPLALII